MWPRVIRSGTRKKKKKKKKNCPLQYFSVGQRKGRVKTITCKIGQKGWPHEKTPFVLNCMACQRGAARGKFFLKEEKTTLLLPAA